MSLLAAVSFTVDGSANEQNVRLIATFPETVLKQQESEG